jgi:tRNA pseudouridine55 synthase
VRRIGHGGTLDPGATGVLAIAVGKATRLLPYVPLEPKEYRFALRLGRSTDTHDEEGQVVGTHDASAVDRPRLEQVLAGFRGQITQVPPMYSAVHHKGERLYEIARRGEEVERAPRPVTIHRLEIVSFEPGPQGEAQLVCECSGGTYMRTLCNDVGEGLGVGGHMARLTRVRCGAFALDDAVPLDGVTPQTELTGMRQALRHLDSYSPPPIGLERALHGNPVRPSHPPETELVCILDGAGDMVALARWQPPALHPFIVLR